MSTKLFFCNLSLQKLLQNIPTHISTLKLLQNIKYLECLVLFICCHVLQNIDCPDGSFCTIHSFKIIFFVKPSSWWWFQTAREIFQGFCGIRRLHLLKIKKNRANYSHIAQPVHCQLSISCCNEI